MTIRALCLTCALVLAALDLSAQSGLEFSCAAFPAELSEAELVTRYGAENVTTDSIYGLDDGPVEGTVVFAQSPEARLEVMWAADSNGEQRPYSVRAIGTGWTTPDGIHLGLDLRTVESMNGWPFRMGGLDWEPLGRVRSWGRGRLSEDANSNCVVAIHFQPARDGSKDPLLMRQVDRGTEFSSGHPAMQEINPEVAVLRIYHPR